jgi:hypothetical protein
MLRVRSFRLRSLLLVASFTGMTSGLLAGRALYVLHVVECTSGLEKRGLQVQSDFSDRYGLLPPHRRDRVRSLFEWSLSNPVHVSFLTGSMTDTDHLAGMVATFHTVQHITLSTTSITLNGLEELLRLPRLETLFIDGSIVNDQALRIIVRSKTLQTLTLANGPITDDGLQSIAGMPNLTRLNVCKTKITAAGLAALRDARPDLTVDADIDDALPLIEENDASLIVMR